ncbi:MAG: hypothetical protein HYS32_03640 [Candidatus Woesearchaeota archaeon]|nr:MAG: hypothetical protein HYS32_03640 [Candidatus Woesearchaeota archaeon]
MNSDLAEFTGAMIGDGCISTWWSNSEKRYRKVALLTGHLKNDRHYYEKVIRPIIIKEFGIRGYIKERTKLNCLYLVMSTNIFNFFKDLGFPIGKKKNLKIPSKIMKDLELSKACVRGIFNTDGSIYRRYSKKYNKHPRVYDYLVIQFKLNAKDVVHQIKLTLENLGIKTNKVIKDKKAYTLRITNQEEIRSFMKIIKPTNKYHVERYINCCKKN